MSFTLKEIPFDKIIGKRLNEIPFDKIYPGLKFVTSGVAVIGRVLFTKDNAAKNVLVQWEDQSLTLFSHHNMRDCKFVE